VTELSDVALDTATLGFIESFGQLVSEGGLPPSIGRVLGLLVIYETNTITSEDIGRLLRLSTGSVSTALNLLAKFGYVKRIMVPGDRRYYYEFEADSWQRAIDTRLLQVKKGIDVANEGLKLRSGDPRLLGMRNLYEQMYDVLKDIHIKTT
jgi:DNA-binding transcriptional regulator GbsR (MarR family)